MKCNYEPLYFQFIVGMCKWSVWISLSMSVSARIQRQIWIKRIPVILLFALWQVLFVSFVNYHVNYYLIDVNYRTDINYHILRTSLLPRGFCFTLKIAEFGNRSFLHVLTSTIYYFDFLIAIVFRLNLKNHRHLQIRDLYYTLLGQPISHSIATVEVCLTSRVCVITILEFRSYFITSDIHWPFRTKVRNFSVRPLPMVKDES